MKKILTNEQLNGLSEKTKTDLYYILLRIESELQYNCEDITNTINFLQNK